MDAIAQKWRGSLQVVFGFGLAFLFFYMVAPFLVPLFLGAIVAILCFPVHAKLSKRLPKWLSAICVTTTVTFGVLVPLAFLLVNGAHRVLILVKRLRLPHDGQFENLLSHPFLTKILSGVARFAPVNEVWLEDQALGILQAVAENVSRIVGSFLGGLPMFLLAFVVVILALYFLLMDGDKFLRFLSSLSPMAPRRSVELFHTFETSCRGVVLGLFLSAVVQGVLIVIFYVLTDLPNAFLMGVLGLVLGMVPVVGTTPITVGAVIYLFAAHRPIAAVVMIVGALFIGTSDNVVRTWVLRGSSEMHPLLALVSTFGAVNLLGATGIFLGPIIAAVFISFLKIVSLEIQRDR